METLAKTWEDELSDEKVDVFCFGNILWILFGSADKKPVVSNADGTALQNTQQNNKINKVF